MKTLKRKELFGILNEQPKEKRSGSENTDQPKKKVVARKTTRKVEMGWVHEGRQVRKKLGGGTRKFDIHRNACKNELLEYAKTLFFPEGVSSKGKLEDFQFDILDFKQTPLPNDITIENCYEIIKMGIVTFYLHTQKHTSESTIDNTVQIGTEATDRETELDDTIPYEYPTFIPTTSTPNEQGVTPASFPQPALPIKVISW
jgi:hypothetical protein